MCGSDCPIENAPPSTATISMDSGLEVVSRTDGAKVPFQKEIKNKKHFIFLKWIDS
jgi:hypothetical protein